MTNPGIFAGRMVDPDGQPNMKKPGVSARLLD
jgi:hypothetical protein